MLRWESSCHKYAGKLNVQNRFHALAGHVIWLLLNFFNLTVRTWTYVADKHDEAWIVGQLEALVAIQLHWLTFAVGSLFKGTS